MEKFECKNCKYTSSNKTHFQRHCLMSIKHLSYEETKNYCTLCNKQYDSNQNYKYHKYNCHKRKINKKKVLTKKNTDNDDEKIKKIKTKDMDVIKQNQVEIIEEIKDVKFVVNNAISKVSTLIKYLMENQQENKLDNKINISPLEIDFTEFICELKLNFSSNINNENNYKFERSIIKDYNDGVFIENLSKFIINLIKDKNYKFANNKDLKNILIKPIIKEIDILLSKYRNIIHDDFIKNTDCSEYVEHSKFVINIFECEKNILSSTFINSLVIKIFKEL